MGFLCGTYVVHAAIPMVACDHACIYVSPLNVFKGISMANTIFLLYSSPRRYMSLGLSFDLQGYEGTSKVQAIYSLDGTRR